MGIERRARALHPGAWLLLAAAMALATAVAGMAGALGFTEVSTAEGLVFHRAGDRFDEDINFVEIMGGGACWLDHDLDGDLDVFLVDGWYVDGTRAAEEQPRARLFRNDGPGPGPDFADATSSSGLDVQGWTQGCAAADADADGDPDLLVVGYGMQHLWRNDGGRFANASATSGITAEGKCGAERCWSVGAAWADYDRDGCLDVYVINFVAFALEEGGPRGPSVYDGQPNQLYRSNCDGTFTDVTAQAGANGAPSPTHAKDWGVSWLDYDDDGWLDIYVASDGTANILLRNNGNGTFTDKAAEAGVDDVRNGMGLAINDCDDDGDEDLFFTHYNAPREVPYWGYDGFYTNNGNGTFTDRSGEGGLSIAIPFVKWGVGWEDFDNDGDVDLHVAAGHTENMVYDAEQPHQFYLGDGACNYEDARAQAGPAMAEERMSRGSQYADWDHDGTLDVLAVNIVNGQAELLRGTPTEGHHWLSIELRQPGGNPRAIGADLAIELPGGEVLHRRLMPYQSIHGNNPDRLHVGLGLAAGANVTVRWPDTWQEQRFEGLAADGIVRLHRSGAVQRDVVAPASVLAFEGEEGVDGWFRGPLTLALAAQDRGVGPQGTSGVQHRFLEVDGVLHVDPAPLVVGEGAHVVRWWSVDHAGNREAPRERLVGVDLTPPQAAASLDGNQADGWFTAPPRLTLACTDAGSGVHALAWAVDGGPWTLFVGPSATVDRAGEHVLSWRCRDRAGHEDGGSVALRIDPGHPRTIVALDGLAGQQGWWRSAVAVTLAAEGRHATASTRIGVDGGPLQPYAGPVVLSGDGAHEVVVASEDVLGRVEPLRRVHVRIDATPPTLGVRDTGPHVDGPEALRVGPLHRLHADAADPASGVARLEAQVDHQAWREVRDPSLVRREGDHAVRLRAWDAAGNFATMERVVVLDITAPEVGIAVPQDQTILLGDVAVVPFLFNPTTARAAIVGPATLEATAGDDPSGLAGVRFEVDGVVVGFSPQAPWTWTWDLPPTYPFHDVDYVVVDRVGNERRITFPVWASGDPLAIPGALPGALPLQPRPTLPSMPSIPALPMPEAEGGDAAGTRPGSPEKLLADAPRWTRRD